MKLLNLDDVSFSSWENFYAAIDAQAVNDSFMWTSAKIKDWLGHFPKRSLRAETKFSNNIADFDKARRPPNESTRLVSSMASSLASSQASSKAPSNASPKSSGKNFPLEALPASSEVWVKVLEDEIASLAIVQRIEPVVEVVFLTTLTQFKRTGCMRALLGEIFETVTVDGQLWLEVHEKNHQAVGLYQGIGMKRVGKRPAYYRDGGGALLYGMSKSLPD